MDNMDIFGLSENRIYQSHHLNSKFDDEHKWILEYPVLRQPPPKNTPLQFNRELNSKVRFENGSEGWEHMCQWIQFRGIHPRALQKGRAQSTVLETVLSETL